MASGRFRVTLGLVVLLSLTNAVIPGLAVSDSHHRHLSNPSSTSSQQDSSTVSVTSGVPVAVPRTSIVDVRTLSSSAPGTISSRALLRTNSFGLPVAPAGHVLSSSTPNALTAQFPSTSNSSVSIAGAFEGLNQRQTGYWYPPDVQIATGPNYVVEMVNLEGAIFTKQGSVTQYLNLSAFFGTGTDFISDPKILFDSQSGRWFASLLDVVGCTTSSCSTSDVRVATSMTSDPTGFWNVYSVVTTPYLPDQPILGLSDDKVVVSVNDFAGFGPYVGAQYWALNKLDLLGGSQSVRSNMFGPFSNQESVHPVTSRSPTTTQYLVSTGGGSVNTNMSILQFYAITGVPPSAGISQALNITISLIGTINTGVGGCGIPGPNPRQCTLGLPGGNQPGGGRTVATNDWRVLSAVWSSGKLWLTLNDACTPLGDPNPESCFRLIQIDTGSASKLQDFDVGKNSMSYFFPSLDTDKNGNLGLVYGFSSATNSTCCYPSLAVTGQATIDPPGSLAPSRTIKVGSASDQTGRYGDYFGAGVDPTDATQIWVAGEYHTVSTGTCPNGASCWSTYLTSIRLVAYTISTAPSSISMSPGSSANSSITLTSLQGSVGTVSLSSSISPSVTHGPTATLNPTSVALSANQSATSRLTVSTVSSTPTGSYVLTLTGTSGQRSYSLTIPVMVGPDYSLALSTGSTTVIPGASSTATITLYSLNHFNGTVTLSSSTIPNGPSLTLTPSSVTLSSGSSATSTLSLSVSTITPGTYIVTITGTSGGLSHSSTMALNVVDFAVLSGRSGLIFIAGTNSSTSITVNSLDIFTGSVALSASTSSGLTASLSSTSVFLLPGYTNRTILTVAASTKGNYTVTVTGTSGSLTHMVTVPVTVTGDFTISANPSSITVAVGTSASATVTLASIKGFSGTITLSAGAGSTGTVSAGISPVTVTLSSSTSATSTLTVTGQSLGTWQVTVNGTALGFILHQVFVTVSVGGTVCLADPSTASNCSGSAGVIFNGPLTNPRSQLRVGVFIDNSARFYAFDITLKADHNILLPSDADITNTILPNAVFLTKCIGGVAKAGISCPTTDTVDTIEAYVYDPYGSTFDPTATGLLFTAVYNITTTTSNTAIAFQTGCNGTSVPGGVCVTISPVCNCVDPELVNTGSFANGGISYVTMSSSTSVIGPQLVNAQGSAMISAVAQNGWPGLFTTDQVTFATRQSAGLNAGVSPTSCATGGASCNVTLTASAANAGNYFVTVYGTYTYFNTTTSFSSTISAVTTLEVIVRDFGFAVSPTTLNIQQGASGTSTITISSLNGFTGTVSLSSSTPSGLTASLNPASVTLAAGGSASSILTITAISTAAIANYTMTVTGTSGSLAHTKGLGIQVSNFGFSESVNSINIPVGSFGSLTVTVTSINGYSAQVNLIVNSGVPACVSYSYNPNPVQLPARSAATSTLTLTAASTCAASSSLVSIQANSGTWGKALVFYLNITDFSLTTSPTSLTVQAGAYGNSTLTVSPLSGFTGVVGLTTSVSPSGLTCSISPSSITLGVAQSSHLSCYGPAGNYTATITASSGTVVHTVTISYRITDFSMTAPGGITCVQGAKACSYSITISSVNGFSGTVSLAVTSKPAGATVTLSQVSVTLSSGGTATVTVTIKPPSSGSVTVTATSGSLTHSETTHLTLAT